MSAFRQNVLFDKTVKMILKRFEVSRVLWRAGLQVHVQQMKLNERIGGIWTQQLSVCPCWFELRSVSNSTLKLFDVDLNNI